MARRARDVLVITTLDRLGRSTQNMLAFADVLRHRGAGLRVLNLGGENVDTSTPTGSMLFTIMAALAEMEHQIKRERVTDSIAKRRDAGQDSDNKIRNALRLFDAGEPAAQVARDLGMSRATLHRRAKTPYSLTTDYTFHQLWKMTKSTRTARKMATGDLVSSRLGEWESCPDSTHFPSSTNFWTITPRGWRKTR